MRLGYVQYDSIQATLNEILLRWRDCWPGGLGEREYSTLNRLALCRSGGVGYNRAVCGGCGRSQWRESSCGDRHCPQCLGPRQARWAEATCARMPDCPHFHMVFSLPRELWEFFGQNYRACADLFFAAAERTLKSFQEKNWGCAQGSFLGVLHTWGSALNWHPHLHVLVAAGGVGARSGQWRDARPGYAFPLKGAMSRVFGSIFLGLLEGLDADPQIRWPPGLRSREARRAWRVMLSGRRWVIFSRPTLKNTRNAVRYLARYTSRIAISNHRVLAVEEATRRVTFAYTDYREGGKTKERTLHAGAFIRRFARHMVPQGFRRVRHYGLLCGRKARFKELAGAPQEAIAEEPPKDTRPECPHCKARSWRYTRYNSLPPAESFSLENRSDLKPP